MSGRVHMVRSAVAGPVEEDRKPVQRGRRRGGLDCNAVADRLAEAASILWEEKWAAYYAPLTGPMIGAATTKPLARRIGLMVVCLGLVLVNVAPQGVRWGLSLTTGDDDQPVRLVMTRDDPEEVRHAVPVRLGTRTLRVGGQEPLTLTTRDAGTRAMRAFASEAGAFFGSPVRSAEVA